MATYSGNTSRTDTLAKDNYVVWCIVYRLVHCASFGELCVVWCIVRRLVHCASFGASCIVWCMEAEALLTKNDAWGYAKTNRSRDRTMPASVEAIVGSITHLVCKEESVIQKSDPERSIIEKYSLVRIWTNNCLICVFWIFVITLPHLLKWNITLKGDVSTPINTINPFAAERSEMNRACWRCSLRGSVYSRAPKGLIPLWILSTSLYHLSGASIDSFVNQLTVAISLQSAHQCASR